MSHYQASLSHTPLGKCRLHKRWRMFTSDPLSISILLLCLSLQVACLLVPNSFSISHGSEFR